MLESRNLNGSSQWGFQDEAENAGHIHSFKMSMEKSSFRHGLHDLENFRLLFETLISNLLMR